MRRSIGLFGILLALGWVMYLNPASSSAADNFMRDAAQSGLAEVALGNLAIRKAQSPAVRDYGQMMVTDHTAANQELMTLAASKNETLPTTMDSKHQQALDKLGGLSGADFDRQFMRQMVADHQKAVSMFSRESTGHKDADVKAWAAKTLPTLQQHLSQAQSLQQSTGSGMNSGGGSGSGGSMGNSNSGSMGSGSNNMNMNHNSNRGNSNSNRSNSNRSNSNRGNANGGNANNSNSPQ